MLRIGGAHPIEKIPQRSADFMCGRDRAEVGHHTVDPIDVERRRRPITRIDVGTMDLGVVVAGFQVVGVLWIGGGDQQPVTGDAAAVLCGARLAPAGADRPWRRVLARQHGLESDHMLPVVAEIVGVEQLVANIDEHLIEPDFRLWHTLIAVVDRKRAQVVLGFTAVI